MCSGCTRSASGEDLASLEGMEQAVARKLDEVHDGLYEKALANMQARTTECHTLDEIQTALDEKGDGFIKAMWCGDEACEDMVKEKTGVGSRCIPVWSRSICPKPASAAASRPKPWYTGPKRIEWFPWP